MSGVHLHITRQEDDSFRKNYGIHGVPVYMIIDQLGKIVSTQAPRPSKPELKSLLLSLVE